MSVKVLGIDIAIAGSTVFPGSDPLVAIEAAGFHLQLLGLHGRQVSFSRGPDGAA